MKVDTSKIERLQSEIAFLSDCKDSVFFKRLIERVIPLIRELYPDQVKQWQLQACDRYKISEVNEELTEIFREIWIKVEISSRWKIRRQLVRLLRTIRGPAIEFKMPGFKAECGLGLLMSVFPVLQDLYINYVTLPQEYPYGLTALKVTEFEESRIKENGRVYINNEGGIDRNRISRPHPFYQQQREFRRFFGIRDSGSRRCAFSAKVLTASTIPSKLFHKCKKIHSSSTDPLRKWRIFQYEEVLHQSRRSFAPITQSTIDRFKELDSDRECYPDCLWSRLEELELAWKLRGTTLIEMRSPRLRGKLHELGLLSYQAHVEFSRKWNAREFYFLDRPNHAFGYLNRKGFYKCVTMITQDLRYAPATKVQPALENPTNKLPKVPLEESDEEKFCDFYRAYKEKKGLKPYERTQTYIIKKFKLSGYKLSQPYKDSTLMTWMRNENKRRKSRIKKQVS